MPAVSQKQRRFMFAELARKKKGQPTKTQMSKRQLMDYTESPLIKAPLKRGGPTRRR